jgi:tellurite resistance protein TehA-like permease
LLWPRSPGSTVFPVGMYAACSFDVGTAARAPALTDFAHVWVWAGLAIWLIVFLAMLRNGLEFHVNRSS